MKIGVIDWDTRQVCISKELSLAKCEVTLIKTLSDIQNDFDVLVLPLKGCNDQYQVPLKQGIFCLDEYIKYHKNISIFCGIENPWLNQLTKNICYLMNNSEVIDENAQLTAQGVLAEMVKHVDLSFRQLSVDVIGYGHCGKCIVRAIQGLVQSFRIIVKNSEYRKTVQSIDSEVISYEDWSRVSPSILIINTAPSLVITKELMNNWDKSPIILDIASHQGGVDYETARIKSIPAYLLPSLPPLYTPVSAGKILAKAILKELEYE